MWIDDLINAQWTAGTFAKPTTYLLNEQKAPPSGDYIGVSYSAKEEPYWVVKDIRYFINMKVEVHGNVGKTPITATSATDRFEIFYRELSRIFHDDLTRILIDFDIEEAESFMDSVKADIKAEVLVLA